MICPPLKEPLDITDGLDVVVGEGFSNHYIFNSFSLIPLVINTIIPCLFDLILYVPVNNFSVMWGWVFMGLLVLSRD